MSAKNVCTKCAFADLMHTFCSLHSWVCKKSLQNVCTKCAPADIMHTVLADTPGCAKSLLKVLSVAPATERARQRPVLIRADHDWS